MSSHENLDRQLEIKGSSDRFFGLTFFVFFLLIALWPLLWGRPISTIPLGISLAFLAISFIRPSLLAPLNKLWLKFGALLHTITSPIILGIMFYLVIMPIGLLMRLLGKDFLRLRFDPNSATYWIRREPPGPEKNSLHRQF